MFAFNVVMEIKFDLVMLCLLEMSQALFMLSTRQASADDKAKI